MRDRSNRGGRVPAVGGLEIDFACGESIVIEIIRVEQGDDTDFKKG
jgi:hypothetical protein